jgi:hypothetical protein
MNTQNFLYENSDKMPECVYLELMNKLKTDFEEKEKSPTILVLKKSLPSMILKSKAELLHDIIRHTVTWQNREDVLLKIVKMCYWELREFCKKHKLPRMRENPQWKEQSETVKKLREMNRQPRVFEL